MQYIQYTHINSFFYKKHEHNQYLYIAGFVLVIVLATVCLHISIVLCLNISFETHFHSHKQPVQTRITCKTTIFNYHPVCKWFIVFHQLILILHFTLYGHFTQTNSPTAAPLTVQSLMPFGAIKRAVRQDALRACGEDDTREDPLWADGVAFNSPRLVSGWPHFQSPALPAGDMGSY